MDLLRDALDYGSRDDALLHLGLALVPAFKEPKANRLFIDQVFLAASTYLISKHSAQQPLDSVRGGLAPWQEKTTKEFLAANIQSNVSLADLATLCDLSPPQFARLFKRSTGTSPYKWFIERRLALSRLMLESTNDDLAEIALACGFADQSHFTRTFSRIVGLSPAVGRRLQRN
jgi:AraC family transcriptional regulator